MDYILEITLKYMPYIVLGLGAALLILFLLLIIYMVKLGGLKKKYKKVMRDVQGKDIASTLDKYYNRANDIFEDMIIREQRIDKIEKNLAIAAQKIGIVRYDAFSDTSNKLSFAIAVLDKYDTGYVLNGLYGREQSFMYMKPVIEGRSEQNLSDEEKQAIETAKANYENKLA